MRVLERDEFVSRMMAWKASQKPQNAAKSNVKSKAAVSTQKPAESHSWSNIDSGYKRPRLKPLRDASPHTPQSGRTAPRPLVRDDGKLFRTIGLALAEAGYDPGGQSSAKKRVDGCKPWKDGHVYRWAEL